MEENGTVMAVVGDTASVRLLRRATCDKCGICGMGKHPQILVDVPNTIGAKPGDEVRLALASSVVVRAALVVYALPILALLLGYILFDLLFQAAGWAVREGPAIAGAFILFGLSFLWVRSYDRRAGRNLQPKMIGVIGGRNEPADPPQGCSPGPPAP